MLFRLLSLLCLSIYGSCQSSEEVRILGQPTLTCTPQFAIISFHTSEPYQGRVSVMGSSNPHCTNEFSYNLHNNATVFFDLEQCTQSYFSNNGSRIMHAHVDISFHPLVITNFDRVFHLQCIDNTLVTSTALSVDSSNNKSLPAKCSHSTRPASRWESSTFFRLGDSVVHEWNCVFDGKESGRYHTFLTNCNAISRTGEVIHLVDENGCIVDPELLGELVYNNYTARIYGRARMFRFASGQMFRMECHMQMCLKTSTCGARSTPPRCAYTKEDFERRYDTKSVRKDENNFTPGITAEGRGNKRIKRGMPPQILLSDGGPFDHNIVVSSDWITVHNNHYTDIDQITERYYLSTELNQSLTMQPPRTPKHFLLGISFKEGQEQDDDKLINEALKLASSVENTVSQFTSTTRSPIITATMPISGFTDIGRPPDMFSQPIAADVFTPTPTSTGIPMVTATSFTVQTPLIVELVTESPKIMNTVVSSDGLSSAFTVFPSHNPVTHSSSVPELRPAGGKIVTTNHQGPHGVPHLTESPSQSQPSSEPSLSISSSVPGVELGGRTDTLITSSRAPPIHKSIDRHEEATKRRFHGKNRDWRLDDSSFNDTEPSPASINCLNSTQILASEVGSVCKWTGLEHLLLVWSLFSLVGWIILIVFVIYRYNSHRPEWVEFRPRDSLDRPHPMGCNLGREPARWTHPDAFEHHMRHAYRPSLQSSRESVFRN